MAIKKNIQSSFLWLLFYFLFRLLFVKIYEQERNFVVASNLSNYVYFYAEIIAFGTKVKVVIWLGNSCLKKKDTKKLFMSERYKNY